MRDCLVGDTSFGGCLVSQLAEAGHSLQHVKVLYLNIYTRSISTLYLNISTQVMPSSARVGPGKLGYYNGGWIVRSHAKLAGVDSLQVDIYNIYSHIYSAIYNIYRVSQKKCRFLEK